MNNVNLIGRLTRDPELRYTPSGAAVVRFTLAVDRRLSKERREQAQANNQQTADFISCIAWNKTAELIANYMQKGKRLGVTGRIQTGSYEKDGRTVYTTDVVVENMEFLESISNSGYNPSASTSQNNNDTADEEIEGFFPINNDDIPF